MTRRLRPAATGVGLLLVAFLTSAGAVKVLESVHHTSTADSQNARLIATLQREIRYVNGRLVAFDVELSGLLATKHPDPAQIRRLQRQIEALGRRTGSPTPTATATVTTTVSPSPAPTRTVTVTPSCAGVKANGGCVPTHVPRIVPTLPLR